MVISTTQKTMPMLKKNQPSSGEAKRPPTIGTNRLPTTGMNHAGLACLMS
jgi:hypothetical protein